MMRHMDQIISSDQIAARNAARDTRAALVEARERAMEAQAMMSRVGDEGAKIYFRELARGVKAEIERGDNLEKWPKPGLESHDPIPTRQDQGKPQPRKFVPPAEVIDRGIERSERTGPGVRVETLTPLERNDDEA
jgi:hypothetical protein